MSRKFLTNVDLAKNEIQNAVMQVLAAAPGTPALGQVYFDSVAGRMMTKSSGAWIDDTARANHTGTQSADTLTDGTTNKAFLATERTKLTGIATAATANSTDATLLARANHTGTQLAATISDFNTQVVAVRLDQFALPTAAVNVNSQKITNVATPTVDTDAANKGYVDAAVNGTDWKQSVRVATTGANLAALSGLLTIDAVTVVANDRVLVKDQTTGSANGIYLAASGAWTRTTDADVNAEVTAGLSVMVTEGATLADTQWRLTTNDAIVLGTTALVFAQIGAGVTYSAGAGIGIAGNVVSIDAAVVTRKFASTFGDGTSTSLAVTHGLNTLDVQVQVYEIATGSTIECDVTRNTVNQVTLGFTVAPATNALRLLVQG